MSPRPPRTPSFNEIVSRLAPQFGICTETRGWEEETLLAAFCEHVRPFRWSTFVNKHFQDSVAATRCGEPPSYLIWKFHELKPQKEA